MRSDSIHCAPEFHGRRRHRRGHAVMVPIGLTLCVAAVSIGAHEKWTDGRPAARVARLDDGALLQRLPKAVLESFAGEKLAELSRETGWSCDSAVIEPATLIDERHRDPNLRISVSGELLNRLLSQPRISTKPVRRQFESATIIGQRLTSTKMSMRLVPADDQWRLQLIANGTITGDGTVSAGSTTFFVVGSGNFQSNKLLVLDRNQIAHEPAEATGGFDFQVNGVQTGMDAVPLLGRVAQDAALSRLRQHRVAARQKLQDELRNQVKQMFDRETEAFITRAKARVAPLRDIDLPLAPIHLRTTPAWIFGDFCLAGFHQGGADGWPPISPQGSLASLHLHQSGVNNMLDGLRLGGREDQLRVFCRELFTALGLPGTDLVDRVPEELSLRFADEQPLRIDFRDGQACLTASFANFSIGEKQWRDFTVSCTYQFDGHSHAPEFQLVGKVNVKGRQIGIMDRMILERAFARMAACADRIPLLPGVIVDDPGMSDVTVTQCELDGGWFALALGAQPQLDSRLAEAARLPQD